MTPPESYGTRDCVICGDEYEARSPRQTTCGKDECRKENARRTRNAWSRDRTRVQRGLPEQRPAARRRMSTPLAGAVADVVMHINRERQSRSLALPALGAVVRDVVAGVKAKDRPAYEFALTELAAWALLALAGVRRAGDDPPT